MGKRYDTRSRDEILAGHRFDALRDTPGMDQVEQRELRTLDRFLEFAEARGIGVPSVEDFLKFVEEGTSTRPLDDLRTAFDRLLPEGAGVRQSIRDAIRAKKPRSRVCDRRSREAILAEEVMAPYRELPGIDEVTLEDLRVLSVFLSFAEARQIAAPAEADFLAFVADVTSSRRLRSLRAAFMTILPDHPVLLALDAAIVSKSPARASRSGTTLRPLAARRVALEDLPTDWQAILTKLRMGIMPLTGRALPASSVIDSMEDVLREYARVQKDAGAEVSITVEGLRRLLDSKTQASAARDDTGYANQGNRIATRHTAVMRLRLFGEILEVDPLVLSAYRNHEAVLRSQTGAEVPLKFGKLEQLPSFAESWKLAGDLLAASMTAKTKKTRIRLLNEAAVVALWMFIPLRLEDGKLIWGEHIRFDGERYHIDVVTNKADEPLRGRLHELLTPFLDALACRGIDRDYADHMRAQAIDEGAGLFRDVSGKMLSKGYPSSVWRKHFKAGAHISRSRVHTELGMLGPEGVEAALALNAQRDPRTAAFYQGEALSRVRMKRGQDMLDELIGETLDD